MENSCENRGCRQSIGVLGAGSNRYHSILLHPGNSEEHRATGHQCSQGHTPGQGLFSQRQRLDGLSPEKTQVDTVSFSRDREVHEEYGDGAKAFGLLQNGSEWCQN